MLTLLLRPAAVRGTAHCRHCCHFDDKPERLLFLALLAQTELGLQATHFAVLARLSRFKAAAPLLRPALAREEVAADASQ